MNEDVKLHNNRGIAFGLSGRLIESINEFQQALAIDPDNFVVLTNLGNTLERNGMYNEALGVFERSLQLRPDHALTLYNKGVALARINRHDECIACFDHALQVRPEYDYARYNRGLARLALGDLEGGFADCEAGLSLPELARKPLMTDLPHPQWDGRRFDHLTLLLIGEQGIGDTIQFMRYVPKVMALGGNVMLAIHDAVRDLYHHPDLTFLVHGEDPPEFDLQCPLMSVPHRLGWASEIPDVLPLDWYSHHLTGEKR